MAKTIEIKPEEEFARSYVDRLILEKLTEMEAAVKLGELADRLAGAGIGLATVRSLLASNPERFAYHERRWIPAARLEGQGKPFGEAIRIVLQRFGGAMSFELLATEIARIRHQTAEQVEPIIRRVVAGDANFATTSDDRVALTSWAFMALDESVERALAVNDVTAEELAAAKTKLASVKWREEGAVAKALEIASPIRMKVLGAVAYTSVNSQDPRSILVFDSREFFAAALAVPGYVFAPDGVIYPEADVRRWITTAIRVADRLAPSVEMEDAAPIEIKAEDTGRLVERVLSNESSTTVTRLLEEFYEITPGTKTYPDDFANMLAALRLNPQVQWVGGDRFRKAGDVPDYIVEVPEPFQFAESLAADEEGEPVDVELTDEGLSSTLRKLLQHPLAMDVLDEDLQPVPKVMPDSCRLVLKSIHRELGTFPLSQVTSGWLTTEPKLQEAILIDPTGRELQVWINHEARLIYNLFDWWYEQPIESGAVFTLTKTNRPNVFDFVWMDQPDPVVYISSQRMEELRQIGIESEGKSTLDLLAQVFSHWPKGADYLTLLAELNVVRRSSRRLVASLLSSYQCFYQRSGSPVWHFDPKKLDQGFDKTKKKFIKK